MNAANLLTMITLLKATSVLNYSTVRFNIVVENVILIIIIIIITIMKSINYYYY